MEFNLEDEKKRERIVDEIILKLSVYNDFYDFSRSTFDVNLNDENTFEIVSLNNDDGEVKVTLYSEASGEFDCHPMYITIDSLQEIAESIEAPSYLCVTAIDEDLERKEIQLFSEECYPWLTEDEVLEKLRRAFPVYNWQEEPEMNYQWVAQINESVHLFATYGEG